jgi:hypothetical protein
MDYSIGCQPAILVSFIPLKKKIDSDFSQSYLPLRNYREMLLAEDSNATM